LKDILTDLIRSPIIPAIRDIERVEVALSKESRCIFILTGNILNIKDVINRIKNAEKRVFLHVDLLEGVSKDGMGIRYIAKELKPDGIISTRLNLISSAKAEGLFTIQRIFVVDSLALDTAERSIKNVTPDAVEILPAVIPKVIRRLCQRVTCPVIAGGLIEEENDVKAALKEGAIAISVTNEKVWDIPPEDLEIWRKSFRGK